MLIIVTDVTPCSDDAAALAMLAPTRAVDIRLIVATSGNVWSEEAASNARSLLARLRRDDLHICVGSPSSAFQERQRAFAQSMLIQPSPRYSGALGRNFPKEIGGIGGCDDLFAAIAAADRPDLLIMAPASPLTRIVRAHPELADFVRRIYLMGGSIQGPGNATPAAEFNFWFDPEAAETLLATDVPITLLPLEATRTLRYSAEFAALLGPDHPVGAYVRASAENATPPPLCDEVLAAIVLDPGVVSRRRSLKLSVETAPGPRYGAVNILSDAADRRPVEVVEAIDEAAFWHLAKRTMTNSDY
jgi:inosine-uridine nucleoside N-ribohydrolase